MPFRYRSLPRPLVLAAYWLALLCLTALFLYVVENAIFSNISWLADHSH